MIFSKSFGYSVRAMLYIALKNDLNNRISVEEIANALTVPKYFLSKVMKKLVKAGVLNSAKGIHGGFEINRRTLDTTLLEIVQITDGADKLETCALGLRKCDSRNPCPLHSHFALIKNEWHMKLSGYTIGSLLETKNKDFIKSISVL